MSASINKALAKLCIKGIKGKIYNCFCMILFANKIQTIIMDPMKILMTKLVNLVTNYDAQYGNKKEFK